MGKNRIQGDLGLSLIHIRCVLETDGIYMNITVTDDTEDERRPADE